MYADLQHNKEREEWHRLKEKNPRLAARIEAKAAEGVSESDIDKTEDSSDDEDDDEVRLFPVLLLPYGLPSPCLCCEFLTNVSWLQDEMADQAGIDKRFLNVLSKIRQKDQSIYDSTAQLYPESESDPESEDRTQGVAQRSGEARLKDVLAKQVGPLTTIQYSCKRSLYKEET